MQRRTTAKVPTPRATRATVSEWTRVSDGSVVVPDGVDEKPPGASTTGDEENACEAANVGEGSTEGLRMASMGWKTIEGDEAGGERGSGEASGRRRRIRNVPLSRRCSLARRPFSLSSSRQRFFASGGSSTDGATKSSPSPSPTPACSMMPNPSPSTGSSSTASSNRCDEVVGGVGATSMMCEGEASNPSVGCGESLCARTLGETGSMSPRCGC